MAAPERPRRHAQCRCLCIGSYSFLLFRDVRRLLWDRYCSHPNSAPQAILFSMHFAGGLSMAPSPLRGKGGRERRASSHAFSCPAPPEGRCRMPPGSIACRTVLTSPADTGGVRPRYYQGCMEQDCISGRDAAPHRAPYTRQTCVCRPRTRCARTPLWVWIPLARGLRGETRVHARLGGCGRRRRGIRGEPHGCQTQQRQRAQDHTNRFHRDCSFLCIQHGARATSASAQERTPVDCPIDLSALLPSAYHRRGESHRADPERPRWAAPARHTTLKGKSPARRASGLRLARLA